VLAIHCPLGRRAIRAARPFEVYSSDDPSQSEVTRSLDFSCFQRLVFGLWFTSLFAERHTVLTNQE